MDKAALENLLTQVSLACPKSGILHLFENKSQSVMIWNHQGCFQKHEILRKCLLSRIMGYNQLHYPTAAIMGNSAAHESTAQAAYIDHKRQSGRQVTITNSGLTSSQSHPFLGASGDGFVSELGCERQGVLEVKTACVYN